MTSGLYRLSLVAACMANGLSAQDAAEVHKRMDREELYRGSIENTFNVLLGVISEVRSERQGRR